MHRTHLRVALLLVSVMGVEVVEIDTSFLRCLDSFEVQNSLWQIAFFVLVLINGLACVFLISIIAYLTKGISHIDTSSRKARVSLSMHLAFVLPLFPFSLLIKGFIGGQRV